MEFSKPKIGLIITANEWFWKYKMFGDKFLEEIDQDVKSIVSKLNEFVEIADSGIVLNEEQAAEAVGKIEREDVDALIVCPIIWASDVIFLRILKEMSRDMPTLLWFYSPYEKLPPFLNVSDFIKTTSTVGALQFTHILKRSGRKVIVVVGGKEDTATIKEIYEYTKAAKVVKDLKRMKIGLLPWRYQDIANTWCDEFKIMTILGPKTYRISSYELFRVSQNIPENEVESFVNQLKEKYEIRVSEKSLRVSARASLGLARVFDKYNLDAIAIQDLDDEIHEMLKTRPCLYVPSIFEKGRVVSMEGDVHTLIAMLILKIITGQPVLFSEIYTFDKNENIMLMGHTTMLDVNMARDPKEIKIIPDCEYEKFDEVEGAYMYFTCKEGPVTMLSLVDEMDCYRIIVGRGYSLPLSEPRIEGYSHMAVRTDLPVDIFLKEAAKAGAGQHWAVTYGDHVSALKKFAELSGLNATIIK